MAETISIHALTSSRGIRAICIGDEGEALRPPGLPVFGQEDTSDAAKALEHLT